MQRRQLTMDMKQYQVGAVDAFQECLIVQFVNFLAKPGTPPSIAVSNFAYPFSVPFLGSQDILEQQTRRGCR